MCVFGLGTELLQNKSHGYSLTQQYSQERQQVALELQLQINTIHKAKQKIKPTISILPSTRHVRHTLLEDMT